MIQQQQQQQQQQQRHTQQRGLSHLTPPRGGGGGGGGGQAKKLAPATPAGGTSEVPPSLVIEQPRSLFQLARRKIVEFVLYNELESTQEQASGPLALTGSYLVDEHLVRHAVFALVERLVKRAIGKRDKMAARTKLVEVPDDLDDETVWRHHVHRPEVPWMNYILHFERRCATAVGPNDLYFGTTTKNDSRAICSWSTKRDDSEPNRLPPLLAMEATEARTLRRFLTWLDEAHDAEEQAATESWSRSVLVTDPEVVAVTSHVPRTLEFMA
jgi:hypothetical protein